MREKLRKARALAKWLSLGKLQDSWRSMEWIAREEKKLKRSMELGKKKRDVIRSKQVALDLRKKEVLKNLRFFTETASDFIRDESWFCKAPLEKIKKELEKKEDIDFEQLKKSVSSISEWELKEELYIWTAKNAEEIEKLLKEELNLPDNVVVGVLSQHVPKEMLKNSEELNTFFEWSWPLPRETKYSQKLLNILRKGKDAIIINPLGEGEELKLGIEKLKRGLQIHPGRGRLPEGPEEHRAYFSPEKLFKHESGHQWETAEARKRIGKIIRNIYGNTLSEAIAFMWEGVKGPYELADSADAPHTIGYEIAKNAKELGIKPEDLVEGFKNPEKTVKELIGKLEKINPNVAKRLRKKLEEEE